MNEANEALKNWQSLLPALEPFIDQRTKSAVRRKKMDVATAPNGETIGVQDPGDTTVINIPYQPACAGVSAGQSVWVEWLYDSFSTAIAATPGNGVEPGIAFRYLSGSAANAQGAYLTLCETTLEAGYSYFIIGCVWTNYGNEIQVLAMIDGADYSMTTRTSTMSGQGVITAALCHPTTSRNISLKSYGYAAGTWTISGNMIILRFPVMKSF